MKPLSPATARIFAPVDIDKNEFCKLTISNELDKFAADFWRKVDWSETNHYSPGSEVQKLINRFAERKRITTGNSPYAWNLAATDYTVEILNDLWPKDQLLFHDDATQLKFNEILLRSIAADLCAEVTARYKESRQLGQPGVNCRIIPEHNLEFSADNPLAPYQQIALCNSYTSPGYGLFMEQGTGKTPPTIAVVCNGAKELQELIAQGLEQPRMYRALIVCPKNLRANWENEICHFGTQQGQITVLRGADIGRVKQLYDAFTPQPGCIYTVVICSYETLTRSWEALEMVNWDISVLDESHSIRSVKTKRFDTCVNKLRDKSSKRLVLTGTPICNTPLDTFAQFEFMGKGYSGFSSWEGFRKFYGVYDIQENGHQALVAMQNMPFMQERLARYSFIINKAEALPDLPTKQYDIWEVEMTPQQTEYYNELRAKLAIEIEADLADDSQPRALVINNILTKLLRLAQITSGFITWSPIVSDEGETLIDKRLEYFVPNPKIEAVREIAQTKTRDDKTIIWSCWNASIEYLESMAQQDGLDYVLFTGRSTDLQRKEAEERFNLDPNCQWFIGNPAAGGQGLNLLGYDKLNPDKYTTNANHVIYYDQNWSPVARQQSEDRANRRGTRVPTRITDLMVARTIDEEIRARVLKKKLDAMTVSDLRLILNAVLSDAIQITNDDE